MSFEENRTVPISLGTFNKAIAPFWPEDSRHGTIKTYLANGSVLAIFVQGRELPTPPDDFWIRACGERTARCVLILPATSRRPSDAENLVAISVDEQTTAAMQSANSVFVYDAHGRCVHADRYHDLSELSVLLPALLPAVALASAPVQPPHRSAAVTPPSTTTPVQPARRSAAVTPPTAPAGRNDGRRLLNLASLDASVAPLFGPGRTSLLRVQPIRDARARSKRVVLCFWATYCRPCIAEMGELARLRKEHPTAVFVGLLDDSDSDDIREMARKMIPSSFSQHYFLADDVLQSRIFGAVSIPLPAFAVFDANGELRDAFVGSLLADPKNHQRLLSHLR